MMSSRSTSLFPRLLATALLAFGIGATAPASATLMITVDSLATAGVEFTAVDDGALDLLFGGQMGALGTGGTVAGLSFGIMAFSGAPDVGELVDTNFEFSMGPTAGAFEIRISDDSFELGDLDSVQAFSLISPTTISHLITVETRVDGQTILATDPLASGVNQSASRLVDLSEPSTIEHIIRIAAGGTGGVSTFDTRTVVAEPESVALMGLALLGLAFSQRRGRKARA